MSFAAIIPALAAELYAIRAALIYWWLRAGPMPDETTELRRQLAPTPAVRALAPALLRILPAVAELTCLIKGLLWGPELLNQPWLA